MKGFIKSRDALSPTFYHLTALLENDIKVRKHELYDFVLVLIKGFQGLGLW